MDTSHLLRSARRRLAVSQREFAGRIGVPVGTLANWESGRAAPSVAKLEAVLGRVGFDLALRSGASPVDNTDLITHLHLSLTQRLRLALDENPRISVSVRPRSTAWRELVALARAGDVLLQPPLAYAMWIPVGAVAPLAVTFHRPRELHRPRDEPPQVCTAVQVTESPHAIAVSAVPVMLDDLSRRVFVLPPAELVLPDRQTVLLHEADRLLHTRAPLDRAGRRRPAHRDPEEYREDLRLMVTKAVHPDTRPDVRDGRAWRLGAAASLAQRMPEW